MQPIKLLVMISVAAAMLTACNNGNQTSSAPQSTTNSTIYSFGAVANDGLTPQSRLIQSSDGNFYGTTTHGGANGKGTVFKLTPAGGESVIYSFKGGSTDGDKPLVSLLEYNGDFYGTTVHGGSNNKGTVFRVTKSGVETMLYSFKGGTDGALPTAGLLEFGGMFYGTTESGGASNQGTVYSITPDGTTEKVLHSFAGGSTDGARPAAALLEYNGIFYGTTTMGGATQRGSVFSITPAGVENTLHFFGVTNNDGIQPQSALIVHNGIFYGTTYFGGSNNVGTVFSITPTGKESVIHSFNYETDGSIPKTALLEVNGVFYGTTLSGGHEGYGTVYGLNPSSGNVNVLHSFTGGTDGAAPVAALIQGADGYLYGVTAGQAHIPSTIFKISPNK